MPVIATCSGPRGCGRKWSGTNQAHCGICHEHFSTVKNFDAHKPGPRRADGTPSCGSSRAGGKHVAPDALTRTKRDGTVVPLLKSVDLVDGPIWVSFTEDTRFDGDDEDTDG